MKLIEIIFIILVITISTRFIEKKIDKIDISLQHLTESLQNIESYTKPTVEASSSSYKIIDIRMERK